VSLDNKFVRSLIQNAKQGNNAAIEQLFQMNFGKIYAFTLRLTANQQLAESITKDTFIEAWKKINLVRPDASFLKWLNAITVYKTLDIFREQKQDTKKNKSEIHISEMKDELDKYILNLPEQERMVFVLSQLEGYTVEEVSDLMGTKKDQVNIHLKIANDKIADNDPDLKSADVLKERIAKLKPEIEPPMQVRDGIFAFIMEEKLKEQKEIQKIADQVEKEERGTTEELVSDVKEEKPKKEVKAKKKKPRKKIKIKVNTDYLKKIAFAVIAAAVIFIGYKVIFSGGGWEIIQFTGAPMLNNKPITDGESFPSKATITTDNKSSVTFLIPEIGKVLIDSSSVVQRMDEGFEIKVEEGQIKKYEGNATDFLTVQTSLALIKGFYKGSAFKLKVINPESNYLSVESGWVNVEVNEFKSYIPKNYSCLISKGHYVLPVSSNTKPELQSLLEKFTGVNDPSISAILALVTKKDAIAVWHLLQLVSSENRFLVYDKLNELIPAPSGVTKSGIQGLNRTMLLAWRQEIELKME
jgi:RNA polymerase sigma-70 factor (ECF subfamily)